MSDPKSPICLKSEIDLFTQPMLQLGVDSSHFIEVFPVNSLTDKSSIEFLITGNGEQYIDLSHTILHLQIKVLKSTGNALVAADSVAPINYILGSMFSELSVFLNDKQVTSQNNYAYRALLESLLFSSKSAQNSLLTAGLFYKDTASKHDNVADDSNVGFATRKEKFKLSKLVDLTGPLHFDLGSQPKLLINGVSVRIKLERNKNTFCLMAADDAYKLSIKSASLFVRKVNIAPSVLLAHEKALGHGLIKLPIRRVEVKSFALSSGLNSFTIPNAFIGQLPSKIILGFVSNDSFNGHISKNAFKFHHYNLNYLCVLDGSRMIPSKPFQPDFTKGLYARSYLNLFTDLNRYHDAQNINVSFDEFKDGYTLFAVDMTPDLSSSASHVSVARNGNLAIDMKFSQALDETVSLIVYAEYRNVIEIDKARSVYTDY